MTFPAGTSTRASSSTRTSSSTSSGWIQAIARDPRARRRRRPDYAMLLESTLPVAHPARARADGGGRHGELAIAFAIGRRLGGPALGARRARRCWPRTSSTCATATRSNPTCARIGMLGTLWLLAALARAPDAAARGRRRRRRRPHDGDQVQGILLLVPAWIAADRVRVARAGWRRFAPSGVARRDRRGGRRLPRSLPVPPPRPARTTFTSWFLAFTVFATRPRIARARRRRLARGRDHFVRDARLRRTTWTCRSGTASACSRRSPRRSRSSLAALAPRRRVFRMAAGFAVVYYFVVGLSPVHLARYLTALVPFIALLLAALVLATAPGAASAPPRAWSPRADGRARRASRSRGARPRSHRGRAPTRASSRPLDAAEPAARRGRRPCWERRSSRIADPELPPGVRRDAARLRRPRTREGVTHVVTHEHPASVLAPEPARRWPRLAPTSSSSPSSAVPRRGRRAASRARTRSTSRSATSPASSARGRSCGSTNADVAAMSDDRRDPRSAQREHFEALLLAARGTLYWAERTAAGRRRRDIRSRAADRARPRLPRDARILEVGCGIGDYTPRHRGARRRARVVSLDVAPGLVGHARRRSAGERPLPAADVEHMPFPRGAFDAVVGNAVLHHLRLDRARARRCCACSSPAAGSASPSRTCSTPRCSSSGTSAGSARGSTTRRARRRSSAGASGRARALGFVDVAARPFDFLYPLTPDALDLDGRAARPRARALPLVAEIAGSLLISGRKPG